LGLSLVLLAVVLVACGGGDNGKRAIVLATTTSTQDSGLLDELVPRFERATGYGAHPPGPGFPKHEPSAVRVTRSTYSDSRLIFNPCLFNSLAS
jgi:tungstate transport system substrate-binding protein